MTTSSVKRSNFTLGRDSNWLHFVLERGGNTTAGEQAGGKPRIHPGARPRARGEQVDTSHLPLQHSGVTFSPLPQGRSWWLAGVGASSVWKQSHEFHSCNHTCVYTHLPVLQHVTIKTSSVFKPILVFVVIINWIFLKVKNSASVKNCCLLELFNCYPMISYRGVQVSEYILVCKWFFETV